mmetsp:Transcript_31962/g.52767  ORF Transcript_31962/g.52767 Transcript_31962/m.52767 type:complete len:92 (-) Transcript_31962:365-640(-)
MKMTMFVSPLELAFISSIVTVSWIGWRDAITQSVPVVVNQWLLTMMSGILCNRCDDSKENCGGDKRAERVYWDYYFVSGLAAVETTALRRA